MTDAKEINLAELKLECDRAVEYALDQLRVLPKSTPAELEAHITSMLIVFWGALWGTFGTEYATGFIEAQMKGMQSGTPDRFVPAQPN